MDIHQSSRATASLIALRYLERLTFRRRLMFPPNEPNGFFELIEMAIVDQVR